MCSIMGFCGSGVTFARFKECFDRTVSRGPDDTRYVDTGRGLLGFHRLAIMGLHPEGMQPFELHGSYAVCNGEIYGFEKLREELITKGYKFQSESDCEILLPLYEQVYSKGRRDYWEQLDDDVRVYAAANGLEYMRNDDSIHRPFAAAPVIVNFFYHEEIKKSAKKGGVRNA